MCFGVDSHPPIDPVSGASVDTRRLTLQAADKTEFAAFEARGTSDAPSILVLPDVRGLYGFYEELAVRFAERGMNAVAIDYFGRTAGVDHRDDEFDYMPHVRATTFDGVSADGAAAVEHLRSLAPDAPVFAVGFCFGGSNSWHLAGNGIGLAGAIGFYGHPNRVFPDGATPLIERVDDFEAPLLCLMGGTDPGIPNEETEAFGVALTAAGKAHEIKIYDGAPHSFFDRSYEEFATDSADAWDRVLEFIERHS
jgi:carboxymethylenebutenolidase